MLDLFWDITSFIIALGTLITVHECGHFIVARCCGVVIERFSIGFGKVLWRWRDKRNTEYVISMVPLGGYVKMLDEFIQSNGTERKSSCGKFNQKKIWQRSLIVFSGPMFNFLFSVLLYWFVFMLGVENYRPIIGEVIPNSIADQIGMSSGVEIKFIDDIVTPNWDTIRLQLLEKMGKEEISIVTSSSNASSVKKYVLSLRHWVADLNINDDPILKIGIIPFTPYIEPIIMKVYPGSSAKKSGLRTNDKIISIDNQLVDDWQIFANKVKKNPGKTLKVSIERQKNFLDVYLIPDKKILSNGIVEGYVGVLPKVAPMSTAYKTAYQLNFVDAFNQAIKKSWQMINFTVHMLLKLITGSVGLNSLSGPISIAQGAGISAEHGLSCYFMFLAMISINLGIINLLPLPVLDGGHLLFLMIEKFKGRPISLNIQDFCYRIGFIFLMLLMGLAIFNDLSRL
ncbi:sigma E protease regulator RseP [Blochmannia endosymbiont of Colobopsis nipponica]|uniref:sigma E protease regulator RseP n=1 Tax=Blochmannia endosymbiont of Colobopsis nipponica TaxID=2681987 RepID=UPI00177DEEF7|nr:sigma E protease regulator RseP [Blochmannia endosymbiont of Colobopsis nipponica]QOI11158.1 sigma E protease regulator RseP [Blochmannia endosymbiont of Colobopsis nipponica]